MKINKKATYGDYAGVPSAPFFLWDGTNLRASIADLPPLSGSNNRTSSGVTFSLPTTNEAHWRWDWFDAPYFRNTWNKDVAEHRYGYWTNSISGVGIWQNTLYRTDSYIFGYGGYSQYCFSKMEYYPKISINYHYDNTVKTETKSVGYNYLLNMDTVSGKTLLGASLNSNLNEVNLDNKQKVGYEDWNMIRDSKGDTGWYNKCRETGNFNLPLVYPYIGKPNGSGHNVEIYPIYVRTAFTIK